MPLTGEPSFLVSLKAKSVMSMTWGQQAEGLTEVTMSFMALLMRKTDALSMFFKSSFWVPTGISISFWYSASRASSRQDHILE